MAHTQKTQSKFGRGVFAVAILAVVVAAVLAFKYRADEGSKKLADATLAVAQGGAASSEPVSNAAQAPSDENLTGREAGAAFSDFVGTIQSELLSASVAGQIYMSKIKQDISFGDLQAFRSDAEAMKSNIQNVAEKVGIVPAPGNVTDADSEYFEKVRAAALDLVSLDMDMAVDIAVNAHTGMDVFDDVRDADKKAKHLRKRLDDEVMMGYQHFGYRRNEVDAATLTLKK
ncbi:hypothetical protein WK91_18445 [Burkholderia cepacia]|uniref:hypothetical protein n=1 Tax=Burkholderia cepacia TaxID=292 RepID=UPI00075F5880|nr:hypothetical protein [Burkholderia cepacia]KVW15417.1 hypothetical protein WK91_18445 [Burkholderia cepacia]